MIIQKNPLLPLGGHCPTIVGVILTLTLLASCNNDMTQVQFFNRQVLPTQTLTDAHVLRSSEGNLQLKLQAPYIEKYQTPEAKTLYPRGVFMQFYNEDHSLKATLRADRGFSLDARNIMKVSDSVVIIDYTTSDTIYLRDMIWNSERGRVYSNNPVRMVNGERVTLGTRFVSDDRFENITIFDQHGTFAFKEDE